MSKIDNNYINARYWLDLQITAAKIIFEIRYQCPKKVAIIKSYAVLIT